MNIKLVSVFAVLAIAIGVYGITHQQQHKETKPAVAKQEKRFTVYLAKTELSPKQAVTRSDVYIEQWPEAKANQYGLDSNLSIDFSQNPIARKTIQKNQLVYRSSMIYESDPEYVDYIVDAGMIAFPVDINSDSIVGGVIHSDSKVDILALASTRQNLANGETVNSFRGVSLTPVLRNVRVLKLTKHMVKNKDGKVDGEKTSLVLELNPKQVATLTIAKRIAQLEVHQSVKNATAKELSADAGDVLDSYHAITEFRAGSATVK